MRNPTTHAVTRLLLAWHGGDAAASDQLMTLVYDELRHLARGYLRRERPEHTLEPTALVHEAYLRLVDATQINWQSRAHFFGIAARVMRQILVDHARVQSAAKRGEESKRYPWMRRVTSCGTKESALWRWTVRSKAWRSFIHGKAAWSNYASLAA